MEGAAGWCNGHLRQGFGEYGVRSRGEDARFKVISQGAEGIVVTGTGSNGYVQVGDLQAALKAWDEAHAADEGDEEGEG